MNPISSRVEPSIREVPLAPLSLQPSPTEARPPVEPRDSVALAAPPRTDAAPASRAKESAALAAPPAPPTAPPVTLTAEIAAPPPLQRVYKGYDRTFLDPTVRPQDDFYQYAMGGYLKSHPIPADRQSWGIRAELSARVDGILKDICETAAATPSAPGSPAQKLGDLYASGMDTEQINRAGVDPLRPVLDRIDRIASRDDLVDTIGWLHASGFGGPFSFGASQDVKNPEMMIGEADQGGLSLPEKTYYLDGAPDKAEIRKQYQDHVGKMLTLLGDAPTGAATVMSMETALAQGSLSRAERRDPTKLYHVMDRAQLAEMTPHFAWDRYFAALGRPDVDSINIASPEFFKTLDAQIATRPLGDWKTWLRWRVLNATAGYLSKPFEDQNFAFKSGVLSGVHQQTERWKKIASVVDGLVPDAMGQKFVEKSFPPEAKQRARAMVLNIRDVMRDRIVHLGWMSDASKQEALAKIDRLNIKIGYPDQWDGYSGLQIDRGPLAGNVLRAQAYFERKSLDGIGKPVDRGVWEMTPATINAYYHPTLNEIVFPAARLLPPFFDPNADDATNYGATGATIAHELTHGFDDSGAQFDSRGVMRDWWSPDDKARFQKIADGVVAQMGEFAFDGQQENGKLVEGEAMADLGGVEIAYEALQRALAKQPAPVTEDRFTPQQRFFLSYTICRESDETPKAAHLQMSTDPHPLGRFRVNGPLSNMPAFHQAFHCQPGDAMVRPEEKRVTLWNA